MKTMNTMKTMKTKTKKNKKINILNSKNFKVKVKPKTILERKFIKLNCSTKKNKKDFTCYDDEALYKLKNLWNARHPDVLITTNDTKEIWEQLNEKMSNTFNRESCWLKQKFVDNKISNELKNSFAPESPKEWKKNPNDWLSSIDILNVMKQYEKAYPCFDFIGPSPIDYDTHKMYGECVWEELCHFNLENEIKNGRFKIGIIFNLDPHYKGGSHWVSLYINIKKAKIFYFDSAGNEIPKQIMKFVKMVQKQGTSLKNKINFDFDQNYPVEHQYGNTECGVYSLYFIVHMLEDTHTEEYFKTHILTDKHIEKFRKIYFNEEL